ncbi:SDR family oxidoreductase [Streptomyces sp. Lzd4kr]|nr:SDR family oxidoreductase [Streptomyces sp. Lzd4kr]
MPYARRDMRDRICLVTGANAGIGRATAEALSALGAHVVLVCRSPERGRDAQREIQASTGNPWVNLLLADLSSIAEVRALADAFRTDYGRLDVLVNNAAAIFPKRRLSRDGIEMNLALNHLAYFTLTNLLFEPLRQAEDGRVVNVSAEAHRGATFDLDDHFHEDRYHPVELYMQAKLANVMFTFEAARRFAGTNVSVNCLHPGVVQTRALDEIRAVAREVYGSASSSPGSPPDEGAQGPVYLATAAELSGVSGHYFVDLCPTRASEPSYNQEAARRLWELSAELTGVPTLQLPLPAA